MKKVFFTGHRQYPPSEDNMIILAVILTKLVSDGVTDFYAGGALGWDMICEYAVLKMRAAYPDVKLHLVLPCPPEEQTEFWLAEQKEEYQKILEAADSVEIVSKHYGKNCMKKRNERLVELGDICVCYCNEKRKRSGTRQTVRIAKKQGKKIINIYRADG